ncbi:uncharacterized protein EV422DRAFT_538274 [Fimicolochytrium jonesii]|uniref:uncharacterized protein n=1 Tax=Fimicolochytrium jonesii TaxID=1396493 RepID=UPI0022FEC5E8|nr:uncharacterized protein EV422DRAFT_538274 [Fimicolochytrium jonesii]KAI8818357.1 hypothetical protein EV422DRAFT_538274 [Fimicolochytrium jonesii]
MPISYRFQRQSTPMYTSVYSQIVGTLFAEGSSDYHFTVQSAASCLAHGIQLVTGAHTEVRIISPFLEVPVEVRSQLAKEDGWCLQHLQHHAERGGQKATSASDALVVCRDLSNTIVRICLHPTRGAGDLPSTSVVEQLASDLCLLLGAYFRLSLCRHSYIGGQQPPSSSPSRTDSVVTAVESTRKPRPRSMVSENSSLGPPSKRNKFNWQGRRVALPLHSRPEGCAACRKRRTYKRFILKNADPQKASSRYHRALNFEEMANVIPQLIYQTDDTGMCIWANTYWDKYLGITMEAVIDGSGWTQVAHPDDLQSSNANWRAAIAQGRSFEQEVRIKRRDGSYRWHISRSMPVVRADGRIKCWIGTVTDVHEQKESLAREQAAREASVLKSQFLATMSHEIRTPIAGVIGMAELLRETNLTEEQRAWTDNISLSAECLETIIKDILDFSRVEAGKLSIEAAPFDARALASEVQTILQQSANKKNIQLDLQTAVLSARMALGDAPRIRQILINVVSNAIKFTSPGGRVTIRLKDEVSTDGQTVTYHFECEDTGIGISQTAIQGLFRPFHQAEASTSRRFGGTGLGLSICKGLVELMKGKIWVQSVEGKGSTFYFIIPFRIAGKSSNGLQLRPQLTRADSERLAGFHALVAEDNQINQIILSKLLQKLGMRYTIAADGNEALQHLYSDTRFDVVLMDCHMPQKDGYEATRCIRQSDNPNLRDMTVIAVSANALASDVAKCLDCGMNDHVAKPVKLSALAHVLAKWLMKDGKT